MDNIIIQYHSYQKFMNKNNLTQMNRQMETPHNQTTNNQPTLSKH